MLYLTQQDQIRRQTRISQLPQLINGQHISIFIFQALSTFILAYGVCMSTYLSPSHLNKLQPDPSVDILISMSLFLAISIGAPFTGAHMNIAVTIVMNSLTKLDSFWFYITGQITGAMTAGILTLLFFGDTDMLAPPYVRNPQNLSQWLGDYLGQICGTFILVFFVLLLAHTKYSTQNMITGYMIISIMVLIGRTYVLVLFRFTFHKGCLNPTLGTVFQLIYSVNKSKPLLMFWNLATIGGPISGAFLAKKVFIQFYYPLLQELNQSQPVTRKSILIRKEFGKSKNNDDKSDNDDDDNEDDQKCHKSG